MSTQLEWKTRKVKVGDLKLLKYNPRKISTFEKNKLMRSLEKFGLADIPLCNSDLTVVSGNQRVAALLDLGQADVEIDVRVPNRKLHPSEVKEYSLTANTHNGEWDYDVLKDHFVPDFEMSEFKIEMPSIDVPGFDYAKAFPMAQGSAVATPPTEGMRQIPALALEPEDAPPVNKEPEDTTPPDKPKMTDDDYTKIELIVRVETKKKFFDVLNSIKVEKGFDKLEDAINHLTGSYK